MTGKRTPTPLRVLAGACLMALAMPAVAQLTVSPQTNLQLLARTITGPGVTIANPQVDCHSLGYGQFQYSGSLLGIDEGILLTTGKIDNAVGPNNLSNATFQQHTGGSALLNTVTGRTTYDACKFEFDVIPGGDSLKFDFVFGSEEYNEWVGSQYNDVFGFFISGPGITGDAGIGNDHNIALIPGSNQAVTINNVNNGSNAPFFHDNAGGPFVQYDGFTQGLTAKAAVSPCQTYHLKLIVADASDRKFDSGVFIAKVKSNPVSMKLITQSGADSLIEGCNDGLVRFTRQSVTNQPMSLTYFLQGTAINGTDYSAINPINPNSAKSITIPANQAYVDRPITTIPDAIDEPLETLLFILGNPNCPSSMMDTLVVPLVDSLNATVQPLLSTICQGGQVQLHATGGTQYTWTPAAGLSATNIADPIAQPGTTRTYAVRIQDGDCGRTFTSTLRVSSLALQAAITRPLCNGASNGIISLTTSGGIAPYAYQWSGPNGFTASSKDLVNIPVGTYTVTVTDAACTRTQSFTVGEPAPLSVALDPSLLVFGQNISCSGGHDGSISTTVTGGTGPYSSSWSGPGGFSAATANIANLGAGTYSVNITDANGCTAAASTTLLESAPMTASISASTPVLCANNGNGSATVTVTGGMPVYTYNWNTLPVQAGATATNLPPGNYTVTAHDQYGCSVSATATITGPLQPLAALLASRSDVTCRGASNGSATIAVSGGTPAYSVAWNTAPVQHSNAATGLAGGTYTATATDANGCTTSLSVTIAEPLQPLAIAITGQQHINCFGQTNGSASVQASGGTGPYAYSWNTTPPRSGASVNGLAAGTWTVTATDAKGCTATQPVVINAPAAALSASITASTAASCAGAADGSASVTLSGGTPPYSQTWNTTPPQVATTATGLSAGTWTVNVQDANHCSASANATITQPGQLELTGTVTPAQCQSAANGAVDVTTSSGTMPYTWAWTGPSGFTASTEDINSLAAGGYTLVVTDAHGCSATRSFDVNQPGLFVTNAVTSQHGIANVSCPGGADGAIDLTVSGAIAPYSFSWAGPNGFMASTANVGALSAGTYTATITDHNGCSTSLQVALAAPPAIQVLLTPGNHGGTAIACNGGTDGSITSTINGGNPGYGILWTGPNGFSSTQQNPTGLAAGSYQALITDANGCTASQSTVLTQPAPLVAANGGSSAAACYGSHTGQATVAASGGRPPYSYSWNTTPAQYSATATGLAVGTYVATVTDANGCQRSVSITVGGPVAQLAVAFSQVTPVLCHLGQTGAATAAASGGTAPYTYVWNTVPVITGPVAAGLPAGTWTVTVQDAAGCSVARNIVIGQPAQPLAATLASSTPVTCYGLGNGSASIIVSGGSGNYSITWNTAPAQTGTSITGAAKGNYVATIMDANGCPQALSFPVSIGGPSQPLAIAMAPSTFTGGANVSCPDAHDGSIALTVTGGTPAYTYTWLDGMGGTSTAQNPSGLHAGTYHLNVGDGHGCGLDTTITLAAPATVTATAVVQAAICHGGNTGSITLSPAGGAPPYTFQWTGPGGFTAATKDLGQLPAGVYTVVITDANGCTKAQPFDVTEPGTFSFNATAAPPACANSQDGTIQMVATGGTAPYQYTWAGPNGFHASTASISGLSGGNFHLTLTDANGCSALFSQALSAPPPLHLFAISSKDHGGSDISCNTASDGTITATYGGGTAPYSFYWAGPNGFTAATANIGGLASGTYTLTMTDAHGCTLTVSTTLQAPPALAATAVATTYAGGSGTSCAGATDGSIILSPAGGSAPYALLWSGPGGFSSTSWQITGLAPGSYTATVTDQNGCSTSLARNIIAPQPLAISLAGGNATCNGGASGFLDLSATGGSGPYSYLWNGPNGFTSSSANINDLAAGPYSLTITDANGCTATANRAITEPTPIQASAAIVTAACQGANTGAVDLTPTGGTGSYSFLWTGFPAFSATTEDISALFAGSYTVTITDANGCHLTTSYNVGEPGMFNIGAELSNLAGGYNVSCAGAADGAISTTISGGTGPFSWFWNGPNGFTAITPDLTGLQAGTYQLTVHDANGCNASANYSLVAPAPIAIGLVPTAEPSCNGGLDGSIMASIMGGTAPYMPQWIGPNGPLGATQNLTGAGAGNYQITVTDALGCTASNSIMLNSPAGISANATAVVLGNGAHLSCANANDGSIHLTMAGGTLPYTVAWAGPNGYQAATADISSLAAGTYTATITDAHGCSFATQVQLTAPAPIALGITTSAYSGGNAVSCAGASDGSLALAITGGSPGFLTSWSGPGGFTSTATTLNGLSPGTYSVVVTDQAGCSATAVAILSAPAPIFATGTLSDHGGYPVGCNGHDGSIDLSASGGLAPYQYAWSGPDGFASSLEDLEDLAAGNYTVTITDRNGCVAVQGFALGAPAALIASTAVTSNECDLSNNGTIHLSVTSGTAPFNIAWTGPGGFTSTAEDLTGLASGTYTATITSAAGCTATATAEVIAAAPIIFSLYTSSVGPVNIPCHGDTTGAIVLTATGGFAPLAISWTGPNGPIPGSYNLSGLPAGAYAVTITDQHGCVRDTATTLIEPASALTAALTGTDISCTGQPSGSINATITGGDAPYTYNWRGPDSTQFSSEDLTGIGAGLYQLVVTDANQCVQTAQIILGQPDSTLSATYTTALHNGFNTSCAGSSDGAIAMAVHGGTPGYSIAWTGPNGFTAADDSISGLAGGTYQVTIIDALGCSLGQTVILVPAPPLAIDATTSSFPSGTNISCHGALDGSIQALVTGGVPTYELNWTGPNGLAFTGTSLNALAAGTYCLNATDANGCIAVHCSTLTAPDTLTATTNASEAPCGSHSGTVDALMAGGSAPFQFTWSNGATTEDLIHVPAGSYALTVIDANGCSVLATALVPGTPGVMAQAATTSPLCHGSANGAIALSVTSGSAPFTFLWGDGSTAEDAQDLAAGDHGVTISDMNGCTWDSVITITAPAAINVDTVLSHFANGHNISSWNGHNGTIALIPHGGTSPFTYAWEDGPSSSSRYGLAAGNYGVTITDANGCAEHLVILLTQPDELGMPSGFTPNGDGSNDAFVVLGLDAFPNNQITVFNRWGNVVFDQIRYNNDWRGENQQGQQLPDGTYFVVLRLNDQLTLQHYVDLRR